MVTLAPAPPSSLAAAVEQASAWLADDPGRARQAAEAILAEAPDDPRARLILASAYRRLGDADAAHAILAPLAQAFPRAAVTQYELGATLSDLGQVAPALSALRRAVELNPDLAPAWRALGDRLFAEGDVRAAEAAYAQHARASVTDPQLKPAAAALFDGRLADAERDLRAHLAAHPRDASALHMLADIFARQGRYGEAEVLLAECLSIDPAFDGARFAYADALFHQQKGAQAIPHVQGLLSADPDDPAYLNLLAACLGLVGEETEGIALYERLLAAYPRQPKLWLNYGHALRTIGKGAQAAAAYKRCAALAPDMGEAYWGIANLKVAAFEAAEIAAMRALLNSPQALAGDRLHVNYALGKALEDQGDYASSFRHYQAGAAIRRAEARYDPDETTTLRRRAQDLLTEEFFTARADGGSPSEAPIFIVGLPRSGSTLVEQILASHSAVEGTMELPDIGLIVRDLDVAARQTQGSYPDILARLDPAQRLDLAERYLRGAQPHRKLGRPVFIDKMPNNFQHLGLIQLILPRARIVDVRRHPLAAGFSAFKQHFAQGQAFSYDLHDLGRYYRDYAELMAHFDRVLPAKIHRVIYERLVEDTETEVGRLLAYCGLTFEPACLRFHENTRAVRTVSSEQVRQPIFREGLEQWRRYEPWLDPLKAALGPTLETWDQ